MVRTSAVEIDGVDLELFVQGKPPGIWQPDGDCGCWWPPAGTLERPDSIGLT